jgi:hypothetical protein
MSGGVGSSARTASLPLVQRIVTSDGEAFAEMHDNGASFLMVANATSIIRWIVGQTSERALAKLIEKALHLEDRTRRHTRPPLMLDIGANAGYFGMMAAAYGASVVLFEPQPACGTWIDMQIKANGHGERVKLVRAALAAAPPSPGERLSLAKDGTRLPGCAGHFDIAGRSNADLASPLVKAASIKEAAAKAAAGTSASSSEGLYADFVSFSHGAHHWMPHALRRAITVTDTRADAPLEAGRTSDTSSSTASMSSSREIDFVKVWPPRGCPEARTVPTQCPHSARTRHCTCALFSPPRAHRWMSTGPNSA